MSNNEQNSINEINFTKRCILMSVISKNTNLILVNSFNKIPMVKLYTADSSYENFIYSKIKGAFCLLMERASKNPKYFFRIYSLKDYSTLFNMEINKKNMQYITQYKEDFYFMELRQSFLGFKFLSKDSARIFFLLLNEDPKKEIIEQNEGALNINDKEISKTLFKVKDYIKARLKFQFENYGNNNMGIKTIHYNKRKEYGISSQKKQTFDILNINDIKSEYLDTSILPEIEVLLNNLEIDDNDSSCYLFTEKNLSLKKCKEIIKKYQTNSVNEIRIKRRNEQIIPLTIIDKDCHTIANTNLYTEIMTKNFINNIRTQKRLDVFKKEHIKKYRGLSNNSQKKYQRKTKCLRFTKTGGNRITSYSKFNPDRISLNNYNSENLKKVTDYMDIINSNTNSSSQSLKNKIEKKSVNKENSGKYAKEKRQINSIPTTEMFKEFDDEDEINFDNDKEKNNYFEDSKNINKKINNININNEVNIIEERPEDEEKEKDNKIKDEKRKFKIENNRVIPEKKEVFSMTNFLMSTNKK